MAGTIFIPGVGEVDPSAAGQESVAAQQLQVLVSIANQLKVLEMQLDTLLRLEVGATSRTKLRGKIEAFDKKVETETAEALVRSAMQQEAEASTSLDGETQAVEE